MNKCKTVWVTGASSGLGLHTAMAFKNKGWTVIAGSRSFTDKSERNYYELTLDVTDEDSIKKFCKKALDVSPTVDALVQCAGMLVLGSCEETNIQEFEKVMNTNFFGMVRMNQQILPIMRKQGFGKIVLYSSINGLLGIPFQNAYTASKHAIEGYAECLQMEVKPFGLQVMLIEPGDHRSGSDKYRPHAAAMGKNSPYLREYESTTAVIHHDETNGSDPDRLGKKVVKLLERNKIPFRKRIASPDQHMAVYLHKFTKSRFNQWILRKYYIH